MALSHKIIYFGKKLGLGGPHRKGSVLSFPRSGKSSNRKTNQTTYGIIGKLSKKRFKISKTTLYYDYTDPRISH